MPRILDLRLDAEGRRRHAELTLTGAVEFTEAEAALNGCEILVTFRSNDGELIWNFVHWAVRGRDDTVEEDESAWTLAADGGDRIRFTLVVQNTGRVLTGGRRFDEDLGKDEVLAFVVTRDENGEETSETVRSNQVQGRF